MTNLLDETIWEIRDAGRTLEDVAWVGSQGGEYQLTWDEFTKIANVDYNNGFGAQEVAGDLIVVFDDGSHMYRHEYDGSEYWVYSPRMEPVISADSKPFREVTGGFWVSLAELNKEAE